MNIVNFSNWNKLLSRIPMMDNSQKTTSIERIIHSKMHSLFLFSLLFLMINLSSVSATLTCTVDASQELLASDGAASDFFGNSVAISGNVAVVGARQDDDNGTNSGSAYLFVKDGSSWIQKQKLTGSDTAISDYFGFSVAIDGDLAIVGAPNDDDKGANSGSVYVFKKNGNGTPLDPSDDVWDEEEKLTASDGAPLDLFGSSVAISRDDPTANTYTVIVGAYNEGNNGVLDGLGAAYVFRFDGTTWQEQKLTAFDAAPLDRFGYSVSVSNDVVVVGAYWDDDAGSNSGSAYVFRYHPERPLADRWGMDQKLTASNAAASDFFGYSVAVADNLVVIGSYQDDDRGLNFGSAYVYRFDGSTWIQETELYGSDSATNDKFAFSVSVGDDDVVIVGAPNVGRYSDSSDNGYGSIYVFRKNGSSWVQLQKLLAQDRAFYDALGFSVDISGNEIMAGAPQNSDVAYYAGAAFVFDLTCANYHPADTDNGFRINISEATKYGSYWKNGQTWPTPPNPIPISYATSSGSIWKNGEAYHYDSGFACPQCWIVGL